MSKEAFLCGIARTLKIKDIPSHNQIVSIKFSDPLKGVEPIVAKGACLVDKALNQGDGEPRSMCGNCGACGKFVTVRAKRPLD